MNSENSTSLWREYSFSEIAKKDKFAIVDGPFGTQLHSDEYTETGVPLVRIENLSFSGKFSPENLVFISEKKANQLNRSRVVPGDLIIAKTGATIGKSGVFPKTFIDGIIASSCMKVSCDPNIVDPKLILYMIVWENGQKKILEGAGGSTRTSINIGPFSDIRLFLPESKSEQRKIAEILSTVDDAIEQTEALIRKYQRIKQGLLQDLLTRGVDENGELRPNYKEAPELYRETALGRFPKDWELKKVEDAFYFILGKMLSKVSKKGINPFPYLANRNVQWDRLDLSDLDWMDFSDAEREKLCLLPEDLLVCEGGEVGRTAIWNNEMENCYFQKAIHRLRSRDRSVLPKFMLRYIRFAAQSGLFTNFTSQTSISHLTQEKLKIFPVISPKVWEQENIIKIFDNHDDLLVREEATLKKLNLLKLGMMQDLLTGKVRVNYE